mmetsp:Transcript_127896/g.249278  ORF Transcript_127896/g.249278 Transcript_127896/m.249278 type:complete len:148 (-) Transcript_127896:1216-1659(-)
MAPETGMLAEALVDPGAVDAPAAGTAELSCAREDSLACTVVGLCGDAGGGAPHTDVAALGLCRDWCRQAFTATEAGCIGEVGIAPDKPKAAFDSDILAVGESGAGVDAAAAASLSATAFGSTGVIVGTVVLGGVAVADAPRPRLMLR